MAPYYNLFPLGVYVQVDIGQNRPCWPRFTANSVQRAVAEPLGRSTGSIGIAGSCDIGTCRLADYGPSLCLAVELQRENC